MSIKNAKPGDIIWIKREGSDEEKRDFEYGWSSSLDGYVGRTSPLVNLVGPEKDAATLQNGYTFPIGMLELVPINYKVGDKVIITKEILSWKNCPSGHKNLIGKVGTVTRLESERIVLDIGEFSYFGVRKLGIKAGKPIVPSTNLFGKRFFYIDYAGGGEFTVKTCIVSGIFKEFVTGEDEKQVHYDGLLTAKELPETVKSLIGE